MNSSRMAIVERKQKGNPHKLKVQCLIAIKVYNSQMNSADIHA